MASISFAPSIRSHVDVESGEVGATTVREALEEVFAQHPRLRGYLLDDTGAVRKHVAVVVNGEAVRDRVGLSDEVGEESEIFVMQALSGG